jgi:hypothetical protein
MGIGKLTIREERIRKKTTERKKLLKKSSIYGYKRPEGFGTFDDEIVEVKTDKKAKTKVKAEEIPEVKAETETEEKTEENE